MDCAFGAGGETGPLKGDSASVRTHGHLNNCDGRRVSRFCDGTLDGTLPEQGDSQI
jgi:hypothetical protein